MPHDDAVRMRPHMPGTVYIVDGKRRYPHQRNFAIPRLACLQKPLPRNVQIGFGIIDKTGRIQAEVQIIHIFKPNQLEFVQFLRRIGNNGRFRNGVCHDAKFKRNRVYQAV